MLNSYLFCIFKVDNDKGDDDDKDDDDCSNGGGPTGKTFQKKNFIEIDQNITTT